MLTTPRTWIPSVTVSFNDAGSTMATQIQNPNDPRRNPWRVVVWSLPIVLLSIPLIAMQFTDEVDWGALDFLVMGALLFSAAGAYEIDTRLSASSTYRAGVAILVLGSVLVTWVNLAVGIIGDEDNPLNLMFFAIPLIGGLVGLFGRFKASAMVRAALAMAAAQAVTVVIAVFVRDHLAASFDGFFVAMWLVAAGLFRFDASNDALAVGHDQAVPTKPDPPA